MTRPLFITSARNQINPLTSERGVTKPLNCHEAVLGWLLNSLHYPKRWRLVRLVAERECVGATPQIGGVWMWNNVYTRQQRVSWATIGIARAGDILCAGSHRNPVHSMAVVQKVPLPGGKNYSVKIRGFNNAGTFLHLKNPPPRLKYDALDRDVADQNMWNITKKKPNEFGYGRADLFLVRYETAAQSVAQAVPWEKSAFPVRTGQRWHYNPIQSWRWY